MSLVNPLPRPRQGTDGDRPSAATPAENVASNATIKRLRRRLIIGGIAYLLFVIYGSLVPFGFVAGSVGERFEQFLAMTYRPFGPGSRIDWVVNILLFVPLAFLWSGALIAGRPQRRWVLLPLLVVWPALAGCVEFLQTWFPPRVTSLSDIVAESMGGAVGSILWLLLGKRVGELAAGWRAGPAETMLWRRLCEVYLLGFAVYSLLPFDLSASPADLYRKWRDGRLIVVPFGYSYGSWVEFVRDTVTDIATWVPAGFLAVRGAGGRPLAAWTLCVAVAALVELSQVLVVSRVSDVTDVLMAALGAACGVLIARRATSLQNRALVQADHKASGKATLNLGFAAAYALLLLFVFWYPFNFLHEASLVKPRLQAYFSVPMERLFWGGELRAIASLLRHFLWFVPLGVFLAAGIEPSRGRARSALGGLMLLGVGLFAIAVELGQALLPERWPDVTDSLLYCLGALVGFMGYRSIAAAKARRARIADEQDALNSDSASSRY